MVRLPRNKKQTYRLEMNSRPEMWPSGLTLAMTLTLNFQGQIWNWLYIGQKWSDCHETKSKHIDLNSRPQMWPMGLTLAMTLIFWFTRSCVILTIWWPRSGVRIYQIVTGGGGGFSCRPAVDSSSCCLSMEVLVFCLTHWSRVTHKSVSKIIWTNTGILWIGPLGTNVSEIFIKIHMS